MRGMFRCMCWVVHFMHVHSGGPVTPLRHSIPVLVPVLMKLYLLYGSLDGSDFKPYANLCD